MSRRKRAAEITLKYVVEDLDRNGNVRVYLRRPGQPKVRLRSRVGTPEFIAEYQAALTGAPSRRPQAPAPTGDDRASFSWLCSHYYRSAEYTRLAPRTRHVRRLILDAFCTKHGEKPYKLLTAAHIRRFRDEKASTPEAANSLIKAVRQVFAVALAYDLVNLNPAAQVGNLTSTSTGFHSWTEEDISRFEQHHPIGTMARLAFALLIYSAQRRSDVIRFGPHTLKEGYLCFVQQKNRHRKPVTLEIPLHPDLSWIIEQTPRGDRTFLVNSLGRPFTEETFGNWFRKQCDAAGLSHCSAHGLRKAAARRLAEAGASEHQIMSWTGHTTLKEVARYTRAARQRLLATDAAELDVHPPVRKVPPAALPKSSGTIARRKPLKARANGRKVVPGTGIEPVTRGFSIRCSTN